MVLGSEQGAPLLRGIGIMKNNLRTGDERIDRSGSNNEKSPPIVDEELLRESVRESVRESGDALRKMTQKVNYKMRRSIEALQEEKRLHELIDDYDFDGLDDEGDDEGA